MVEHTNLDSATSFHSAQNDRGIKQQEDVNISVADYPQSTAIIIVDEVWCISLFISILKLVHYANHPISLEHTARYLGEFEYRFNCRFALQGLT